MQQQSLRLLDEDKQDRYKQAKEMITRLWTKDMLRCLNARLKSSATFSNAILLHQLVYPVNRYSSFSGAFNQEMSFMLDGFSGLAGCLFCCVLSPVWLYLVLVKASYISLQESLRDDYKSVQYIKYFLLAASQLGSALLLATNLDAKLAHVIFSGDDAEKHGVNLVDNVFLLILILVLVPMINFMFSYLGCTQGCKLSRDMQAEGRRELNSIEKNAATLNHVSGVSSVADTLIHLINNKQRQLAEDLYAHAASPENFSC